MNVLSVRHPGDTQRYAQGWLVSLLVHSLAVSTAVALLSDIRLAPQAEPFKWEVSMIKPPPPQEVEKPRPVAATPVPPTLAPAVTEPQPVIQTVQVQTVQTVQTEQVVHQEVKAVTPVVQAAAQSTQTVSRPVQSVTAAQQVAPAPTEISTGGEPRQGLKGSGVVQTAPASGTAGAPLGLKGTGVAGGHTVVDSTVGAGAPLGIKGTGVVQAAPASVEQASVKEVTLRSAPATKADYGWLMEALWRQVDRLKRYPHTARVNRWEGKVVLRAVIREDGQVVELSVEESSGYTVLDRDALEILKQASPLKLKHPLGQAQVVVHVPISYKLQ